MGWESVIGRNLRRFRKARGLTQEALADEAEVDIRQIGRIERGQSYPSVGLLVSLAEILNVDPGKFFDRSPDR
jgi:transcriptional regulator with XRE-family HTH domain